MKIVGFELNGEARLGVIEGDQVIDLKAADEKAPVVTMDRKGERSRLGGFSARVRPDGFA